jgi:hypothetical protein
MIRRFTRSTFFMTAGLLIWAADFLISYVFTAIAIARGFADVRVLGMSIVTLTVLVVSLVAAISTVAVLRVGLRSYRAAEQESKTDVDRFVPYLAAAVAALSLIAIVWNAFSAWVD